MKRAIQLGANALGTAAPNPSVGAVLVYKDRIIGEGFTSPYGGPHAEVNAIAVVQNKSLLTEASLYVTLEPCNHFGKTPPCTELILKYGIPRVYVGTGDPHEKVGGKGVRRLEEAGCQVTVGVLKDECREHHRRFLCNHEKRRPYVILKWAQSADGYIAPEHTERMVGKPFWISNPRCRQLVHLWRSQEQAILVGSGTVVADNPRLDTRLWYGPSPLRIVLDTEGRINKKYQVHHGKPPALFLLGKDVKAKHLVDHPVHRLDTTAPMAPQICEILQGRNMSSVLVEGGAQTLRTFIEAGMWDEARIFSGATYLGSGLRAPEIHGRQMTRESIGDNTLTILRHD